MKLNVDYNEIASAYNLRYKENRLKGIQRSLEKIITENNYKTILEVGCGTGHWLNELVDEGRIFFGCDLSFGMLKEAAETNNSNSLFCCSANSLPLKNQSFDFIYCVNALHFFEDKTKFINTIINNLKSGGTFAVVSVDPRFSWDHWYIYDYFEDRYENDLLRFISWEDLKKLFITSGFKNIKFEIVERIDKKLQGTDVFNDYFLDKKSSSQLAALSEKEYVTGIHKIKETIKNNPNNIFTSKISFAITAGKNI